MNKVININFQGRVIPIEEPAYEELKKYVESLRQYFSDEEGKEEIINDIENRIAELFSEKLKNGQSAFISEAHVAAIIASMGRPEDIDGDTMEIGNAETKQKNTQTDYRSTEPRGTLYRNEGDKILGGVCSGLGNYLRIDTTIIRVLFATLALGSFGFGLVFYIILWAILPSRYLNPTEVSRKLYRDPFQKVLGGVCSGIAKYFNVAVWIPRLIFILPLALNFIEHKWFFFWPFAYSFSGTFFVMYLILWAVIPQATTASEIMEMKGEKVDLESIKNKVQDELQGVKQHVKSNADRWKQDFSEKASGLGAEAKEAANRFANQAGPAVRNGGNRFFKIIFTIIKIFFFIIATIIAIALVTTLIGIFSVGSSLMPLKNYIVDNNMISWYFWGTIVLFIAVPVVGLVQWLIRSIAGIKLKHNYIGMVLGVLWTLGWVSVVMLAVTVTKEFKRQGSIKQTVNLAQPSNGRMLIQFKEPEGVYYPLDLNFGISNHDHENDNNGLKLSAQEDSLLINNIRIKLMKSTDGLFHVTAIKRARATSPLLAEKIAEQISFPIDQADSIITIPTGFAINTINKFRNQQVLLQIEVPVGKEIYVGGPANNFHWYSFRSGPKDVSFDFDYEDDINEFWHTGQWYVMTEDGIERKEDLQQKEEEKKQEEEKDQKTDSSNHLKIKPTASLDEDKIDANEEGQQIAYSRTRLIGMGLGLLKLGL